MPAALLPHEGHALIGGRFQPGVITVRWQDHHHAFFIPGFVKLAHQVRPSCATLVARQAVQRMHPLSRSSQRPTTHKIEPST